MNFRKLVQKTAQHARIQGNVTSIDGIDVVTYIAEAVRSEFINLQLERKDFKFMKVKSHFHLTNTKEYLWSNIAEDGAPIARWDIDSFIVDGSKTPVMDFDYYWENQDRFTTMPSKHVVVNDIGTDRSLIFLNDILGNETSSPVNAMYWRTPQSLEANTDVPIIPEEFHYLIVWKALEKVASAMGMQSLYEIHSWEHDKLLNKFYQSQVPAKSIKRKPIYRSRRNQ